MASNPKTKTALRELGALIKAAREALGLSRDEVAARALVNHTTLWRLEEGELEKKPHAPSLHNILQIVKPGLWRSGTWGAFCRVAEQLEIDPYQHPPIALFFGLDGEITPARVRSILPLMRGFTFDGQAHTVVSLGLDIVGAIQESGDADSSEAHELLSATYKELAFAYNQVHPPGDYQASVTAALASWRHAQRVEGPEWPRDHVRGGASTALGSILRVLSEEELVHPGPKIKNLRAQILDALPTPTPFNEVLRSGSAPDRIWARINLMKMETQKAEGNASYQVAEELYARALEDLTRIDAPPNHTVPRMASWGLTYESTVHLLPAMLHESSARVLAQFGAESEAHDRLTEAVKWTYSTYGKFQNEMTSAELLLRSKTGRTDGIEQLRLLPDRAPDPYPRHKALRLLEQTTVEPRKLWLVRSTTGSSSKQAHPLYLLRTEQEIDDPLAG